MRQSAVTPFPLVTRDQPCIFLSFMRSFEKKKTRVRALDRFNGFTRFLLFPGAPSVTGLSAATTCAHPAWASFPHLGLPLPSLSLSLNSGLAAALALTTSSLLFEFSVLPPSQSGPVGLNALRQFSCADALPGWVNGPWRSPCPGVSRIFSLAPLFPSYFLPAAY